MSSLDPATLNREQEWKAWRTRIERDTAKGESLATLKAAWDKRQGEYVAFDDDSDDDC